MTAAEERRVQEERNRARREAWLDQRNELVAKEVRRVQALLEAYLESGDVGALNGAAWQLAHAHRLAQREPGVIS